MNSKIQYYKLCSSIVQYQLFFLQIIFLQQSYFKIVRRHFTIVVQLETKNSLVRVYKYYILFYILRLSILHTYLKEENYLLINGQRGRQACRLLLVKYTKKEKKYFCTLKIEMQVPKKLYQYIRNLLLLPLFLEDISNRNLELHQQHLHLP